ncbi:FAD-dependent oxidoreductase [Deinococcus maricopensis]|uniref:Cyclic nucleotide-binding protein n=1 Tax=Deinococcus maricopensis (strain DSM 21211 / LMG 22137 / NRRL B-23946 / LB-34) TaxID=709986 RepID=E8U333_DEIML|nr:FAD-dependent oxidoreductase [Deinococcus maricopensis]ADV65771.1 cyclic nucleotide-binding protein [Deinococcus maricopensis DSM 21211]
MITADLMRAVPLLRDLDDATCEQLAATAADIHLNPGEWLVQEGEVPAFYVLLSGELEVTKTSGGEAHVLNHYRPGDAFGEVPLLLGSAAVANLRATTESRVMRLEADDFHDLMAASERVASQVLRTMSRRVADLQRLALDAPTRPTLIVGARVDVACYGLREFFSRNRLPFRWVDPDEPATRAHLPSGAQGPYPLVVLPDGTVLHQPHPREVAEHVGLQTRPGTDRYDVVIVGGGPAGLAAAVYGASEGLCTMLVEREAPGGQAGTSTRIENYLGFPTGLSGDDLSGRALQQARRFGAEIVTTREVVALTPAHDGYTVTLDGGDAVHARTVILATGVAWRALPVEGAERLVGRGVYYGAARTEAPGTRGKDVYLIGGGNSAGQAAMHFSGYARRVTLLVRGPDLERSMSQYLIDQLRTKDNIHVCVQSEVTAVHGTAHLTRITVRDRARDEERDLDTDALFVFIGADARTDWLPGSVARDERGYVLTGLNVAAGAWPLPRDPFPLETTAPGVFAAGDVRHGSVKRVASSVGEGSMAIALIHQYLAAPTSPPLPPADGAPERP